VAPLEEKTEVQVNQELKSAEDTAMKVIEEADQLKQANNAGFVITSVANTAIASSKQVKIEAAEAVKEAAVKTQAAIMEAEEAEQQAQLASQAAALKVEKATARTKEARRAEEEEKEARKAELGRIKAELKRLKIEEQALIEAIMEILATL
jgi:hypothetical protein